MNVSKVFLFIFLIGSGIPVASNSLFVHLMQDFKAAPLTDHNCHDTDLDDSKWASSQFYFSPGSQYCLRFQVDINDALIPENPSLFLSALGASEIYLDGKPLANNGIPSLYAEHEVPGTIHFFRSLSNIENLSGAHLLSIRFSTHHLQKPLHQNFYVFSLVDEHKLRHSIQLNYLPSIVLSGFLICVCVIFIFIYWLYRKQAQTLWFSILSFSSALLLLVEKSREIIGYTYDWHIPRLNLVLMLSTLVSLSLCGFYLSYYRVDKKYHCLLFVLLIAIACIFLPIGYDGRSLIVFAIGLLCCLIINIAVYRVRRRQAIPNIIFLTFTILLFIYWNLRFVEYWFAAVIALLITFNLIVMIRQFSIDRDKALEADKLEMELLKRSLQPHFLMNSLTLVIEWIEIQPQKAIAFINALSKEFKLFNQFSQQKMTSLDDEIDFCNNYLDIMSSRLQVTCRLEVSGNSGNIKLPPAIIHTLLENSFTHSGKQIEFHFLLSVTQRNNETTLILTSPLGERDSKGSGLGSRYIKTQLERRFHHRWKFISYEENGHWIDTIILMQS